MMEIQKFESHYNEKSFWKKVTKYGIKAGELLIEKALTLYYCSLDPDTPKWAKTVVFGALGYFILPLDAIPDLAPVVGFVDDFGTIASAIAVIASNIKESHRLAAKGKMIDWLGFKPERPYIPNEDDAFEVYQ